jgi:predicted HicB family RNase H-like nuclease
MLKNITFSVEEDLIAKAREMAKAQGTTLNDLVREWIQSYVGRAERRRAMEKVF